MKALVRCSRGRLHYTGRIPRAAFTEWLESAEGQHLVARVSQGMRFALFGRRGAARRDLWRRLRAGAATLAVTAAVQGELDRHLDRLQAIAYARDLPQLSVELRRLIVVPRRILCADLYRRLDAAIRLHPAFATDDGVLLRGWFVRTVVSAAEAAVVLARPSPRHPLPAGEDWIAVGVNEQFEWYVPPDGPTWPGHYLVLELRRTPITRAVRTAAGEAIAGLETSLSSLSQVRRIEILNEAARQLERPLRA